MHLDDPVAVVVEDAGVDQLVFGLELRPRAVGLDEVLVRERSLRVVIPPAQPGAARDRVEVPPVLLDVLAVVALAVRKAEEALFQDGVALVPEGEGEAEALLVVGDPAQAVFAPAIGPRAGLVMGEVVPGVSVRAVVLADRPPLPLAEVGAPLLPGDSCLASVVQPLLLGGVHDPGVTGSACHRFVLS